MPRAGNTDTKKPVTSAGNMWENVTSKRGKTPTGAKRGKMCNWCKQTIEFAFALDWLKDWHVFAVIG